jgi:subtilisin family serine protease
MPKYVVLRDLQTVSLAEPFGTELRGSALGLPGAAGPQPEARIDVEEMSPRDVHDLKRDPEVVALTPAIPTRLIRPMDVADGDSPGDAWGISAVGADESQFAGNDVVVAVLDTGIDTSHAAFQGVTVVEEDFSGSGVGDADGHGTHCAGTIFGRDLDGTRIGIARGVSRALIGKVLANDGSGSSEMIFRGIRWAVEKGAQVISMSLGFDFPGLVKRLTDGGWPADLATSNALEAYRGNLRMFDALMGMVRAQEAFSAGTVLVAAAGNESRRDEDAKYEIAASLPAAAEGVVSVGALSQSDQGFSVAPFSNTFPNVSAPGVEIKSAKAGGGTATMSGTSMACPHVAGVTALWWEAVLNAPLPPTARTVVAKMLAAARSDVFVPGVDVADRGVGRVTSP